MSITDYTWGEESKTKCLPMIPQTYYKVKKLAQGAQKWASQILYLY
jgi:hypothetical protein